MLAQEIARLQKGLHDLVDLEGFEITLSKTLSRAAFEKKQAQMSLQRAKDCNAKMQLVLEDLNKNEGKKYQGRASNVYGQMRKKGTVYVRQGERHLTTYTMLCKKAIRELQDEEDDEREDEGEDEDGEAEAYDEEDEDDDEEDEEDDEEDEEEEEEEEEDEEEEEEEEEGEDKEEREDSL
ncbi:hypothetical protein DFH27DRAFT_524235 [Peziza echinospora]|nr:hypothetical protein DFH27DRAFT_524235 [Peziza echinospora]